MKVRLHLFIEGWVQGVFFRSEMRCEALKNDVKGWVRNLPDGRVEAVSEGEESNVNNLVGFCRKGPTGARVTRVDVVREDYVGEFERFDVRNGWDS